MRNKVLAIVTIITLAAALVGGGTIAWLTDAAAVENNLFTAGTLDIALDEDASVRVPFDFYDMAPGDTVEASAVAVNAGTLPLQFYALIEEDERSPEADLAEMLDVVLEVYIGDEVDPYATYTETLRELLDPDGFLLIEFEADQVFDPGDTATFQFTVYFREESGNEYQGAWWEGTITFYAFQRIPTLTVAREGLGTIDPDVGKYNYPIGSEVTLTAIEPGEGYEFLRWQVNGDAFPDEEITITLIQPTTATAYFGLKSYDIQVDIDPPGSGTVSGDGLYDHGETVTLTASPETGYEFVEWTDKDDPGFQSSANPLQFTATEDRNLVAHFELSDYTITADVNPPGSGSVSGAGSYAPGDTVTLEATHETGYVFMNWAENDTVVSTSATYIFTAEADRHLVANFGQEKVVTFTTNQAWAVPDGVTSITVEAWGGGGAGGGRTGSLGEGGGGGGGAYAMGTVAVTPGQVYDIVVGAAVSGTTGDGANGNPSYFGDGSVVYAAGGSGGRSNGTGGTGGSVAASIGTTIYKGGDGGDGVYFLFWRWSGGGGGGAGSTGAGGNASYIIAGTGTAEHGGTGGGGRDSNGHGNAGSVYGGGGGGARRGNSGSYNGGAGAAGLVRISYIGFE